MSADHTKSNALPPTNEDTIGPYFPPNFCDDHRQDLSRVHPGIVNTPVGQKIVVKGEVLDRHGQLANGVVLEFWQANANGVYRNPNSLDDPDLDPWFEGYTRIHTLDGRFELTTIKPGKWKHESIHRAPNITLTIFSDGIARIITQLFFSDEQSNSEDPLLQSIPSEQRDRLIADYDGKRADGAQVYTITIIMAGHNETPFFDDLMS